MSFKLLIECSKDIDELHINFSDGTSTVTTKDGTEIQGKKHKSSPKPQKPKVDKPPLPDYADETQNVSRGRNDVLDLDADFSQSVKEVIRPPEIHRDERPTKVASEMQNLDI